MRLPLIRWKMRLLYRGVFMLAPVLGILVLAGAAESRTWHVHQDGSGDAPTIQAAIDSSGVGDSILVAPGTYSQKSMGILSKDSLTIKSEQGAGQTLLYSLDYEILDVASSRQITIDGFTFENSPRSALVIEYSEHITLQGNIVRYALESAIALDMSTSVMIRGNVIYSNGGGIHCMDLTSSVYVYGNTIAHNTGCGFCADDINYSIENNIIAYNKTGVSSTVASFSCNDVFGNDTDYNLLFVPDPTGTNGNISMSPLFCGVDPATSGNYYLQQNSPCAPGNHPEGPICGVIGRY
ncbi:MAG: right-handed parallel beta-helix repeat-containing protein, partial [Candidatus Krumholzibacteriaceae bacterium]